MEYSILFEYREGGTDRSIVTACNSHAATRAFYETHDNEEYYVLSVEPVEKS